MNIEVFTLCWNEEAILPLFLHYYSEIARKIVIYDNGSTDRSHEIIEACPVAEARPFDTQNCLDETILTTIRNNCWKGSTADWVFVVDIDEFVYHPNLLNFLETTDSDVIKCKGYNIVGELTDHLPALNGVPDPMFNKMSVFRPTIKEINYDYGSHRANPTSDKIDKGKVFLLHAHWLGTEDYIVQRYKMRNARVSAADRQAGRAYHYAIPEFKIRRTYKNLDGWHNP
jgi:glycosyltransferase involved in cell wall biosynthesis